MQDPKRSIFVPDATTSLEVAAIKEQAAQLCDRIMELNGETKIECASELAVYLAEFVGYETARGGCTQRATTIFRASHQLETALAPSTEFSCAVGPTHVSTDRNN